MIADISAPPLAAKRKTSRVTFANHTRYLVLAVSIVALSFIYSNTLSLNFTIICMVEESETPLETITANGTRLNTTRTAKPLFTVTERSILFGAVAIGTFIGSLLVTPLISRFGCRVVFASFGALSAIATLATPPAVLIGVPLVALMRAMQGVAVSISMVSLGSISGEWSTMKTTGTYIALLSCHIQLGPILTMPLAGAMCETWGWQWLYYIQGSVSLAIFAVFFYFYRDSPRFQRHVSGQELSTIEKGKSYVATSKHQRQSIPYRAILLDPFTWGFLGTMGAGILSISLIAQFGPVYLNKALGMDVENTSLMAAMPFCLSVVVKLLGGPLSDRMTYFSEKARVIIFASVSQFLMAGCYAALAYLPTEHLTLIQICFTLVVVFSGLNAVGAVRGGYLATQQFCHVLMAWGGLQNSACTLLLPVLVSLLAPDDTADQWGVLFILIAVVVAISNVLFIALFTSVPRPYVAEALERNRAAAKNPATPR